MIILAGFFFLVFLRAVARGDIVYYLAIFRGSLTVGENEGVFGGGDVKWL